MSKRIVALILGVLLLLSCTPSFAIKGDVCPEEAIDFRETGIAVFMLDNSGRILGVLKPDEKLETLNFQLAQRPSPTYVKYGKALRRHKYARVELDENYMIVKGGTPLEVTITLTDLEAVKQVIGENVTVQTIIDATIYSPNITCANVKAAHMFMPQESDSLRRQVGTIAFKDGSCLGLYIGYFRNSIEPDLGFVALKTSSSTSNCYCYCVYGR